MYHLLLCTYHAASLAASVHHSVCWNPCTNYHLPHTAYFFPAVPIATPLQPSALTTQVTVCAAGVEVPHLNELQWIEGRIWANLWREERLAIIDPSSGEVCYFVNLDSLLGAEERRSGLGRGDAVLNGIAHDPHHNRLFVTGKWWPRLYEIRVLAPGQGQSKCDERGRALRALRMRGDSQRNKNTKCGLR